jgi:DNA invertase Pin-like site-specific DNA recombinase
MPKIGYSYIRFSTPEQAEGDSLRRQTEKTVAWCKTNGVTLDTSLKLQDLGVSGFSGQHRDNPDKFGLAAFVEQVRQGKIAHDSYLIVENLDRLTREHLRPAVRFVLELLDEHHINIVTTSPERVFRHDSNDMVDIIIAVVELSRGHGESQRKSDTVGTAWREKKADAVQNKTVLTAMCPHWLEVVDGEYKEIPNRVKLVQRMFQMIVDGTGIGAITRKLNLEKVKPWQKVRKKTDIGKPHLWQKSSVARNCPKMLPGE